MTDYNSRVRRTVILTGLLALAALVASLAIYPPQRHWSWLIALLSMLGLAVVSAAFALRMTQGGATTSLDFVPQLGALLLVGPTGAITLTFLAQILTQFAIQKKGIVKGAYNTAQLVLSVAAAGLVYVLLGGTWSIDEIRIGSSILPFVGAAVTYFGMNRAAVSYILSLSEGQEVRDVWSRISTKLIVVDVAISPLAFLVAYLYVRYGPWSLLFSVLPIIALRYTYGVNIELQQLNRDLLRALIRTLEAQDPYTSGHSIRVAEASKRIAKSLDLSRSEVHQIEQAALLHDIGKVGAEYHKILQQEGPLTSDQTKLIERHPERGATIIEPVRSMPPQIQEYIRHHHEQYDGSGYPDGLAGEKIPLGARVIMVADTIDAMRTTRPYRDAQPLSAIKDELVRLKGEQFDPEVVEAAISAGLFTEDKAIDPELGTEFHSL